MLTFILVGSGLLNHNGVRNVEKIQVNLLARQELYYPKEPNKFELYHREFNEKLMIESSDWDTFNTHDPHIFKDEVSGYYYIYSTDLGKPGIHIRKSADLINWEFVGTGLLDGVPQEAHEWSQASGLWAPDMIKVGDEYRSYYSASTFGSQQSCIGLAVATHPEGPFTHKGLVVKSAADAPVNAIDANLVLDHETGDQYLVYGSFWGGIRMLKLDVTTGFVAEDGFGICLACRPREGVDTSVEGAYVVYNDETGYYYLFVSYGSLSSDYNVRVGRSKKITGPYIDYHGKALTTMDEEPNRIGFKLTTGYKFGDHPGWFALGHNSVLKDDGNWYLIHHTRPEVGPKWPYLHVRKMVFSRDGWPLVSPERFAGEFLQPISAEALVGSYERIEFDPLTSDIITTSNRADFKQDGTCLMNEIMGTWSVEEGNRLMINLQGVVEEHVVMTAWDFEAWKPTIVTTGKNNEGICRWMKQVD